MRSSIKATLKYIYAFLILSVLVAGCAKPMLLHHQLSLFDKGLTEERVQQRVIIQPLKQALVTVDGRNFSFQMYDLNNGVQIDSYVLAFEEGKLLYWGYISEFRRQSDRVLNNALNDVLAQLLVE